MVTDQKEAYWEAEEKGSWKGGMSGPVVSVAVVILCIDWFLCYLSFWRKKNKWKHLKNMKNEIFY